MVNVAAYARANAGVDADEQVMSRLARRQEEWDGVFKNNPADWCAEISATYRRPPPPGELAWDFAETAAIAIDAVMSIDDQRALEGRTFYEIL
jgi:hypothetical protein